MTLMTLTLMTAFHVSSATFNAYFPVLQCFCNKVLTENDRKFYIISYLRNFQHRKLG